MALSLHRKKMLRRSSPSLGQLLLLCLIVMSVAIGDAVALQVTPTAKRARYKYASTLVVTGSTIAAEGQPQFRAMSYDLLEFVDQMDQAAEGRPAIKRSFEKGQYSRVINGIDGAVILDTKGDFPLVGCTLTIDVGADGSYLYVPPKDESCSRAYSVSTVGGIPPRFQTKALVDKLQKSGVHQIDASFTDLIEPVDMPPPLGDCPDSSLIPDEVMRGVWDCSIADLLSHSGLDLDAVEESTIGGRRYKKYVIDVDMVSTTEERSLRSGAEMTGKAVCVIDVETGLPRSLSIDLKATMNLGAEGACQVVVSSSLTVVQEG